MPQLNKTANAETNLFFLEMYCTIISMSISFLYDNSPWRHNNKIRSSGWQKPKRPYGNTSKLHGGRHTAGRSL